MVKGFEPERPPAYRSSRSQHQTNVGPEDGLGAIQQQSSQVEQAMTRISSLINSLEAKRQSLEGRLNPVLSPVPPGADGFGEKDGGNSPLVCELQTCANKLEMILAAFEEMESRIEL